MGLMEKLRQVIDGDEEFEDEDFIVTEKAKPLPIERDSRKPAASNVVPLARASASFSSRTVKPIMPSNAATAPVISEVAPPQAKVQDLSVEVHTPSTFDHSQKIATALRAKRAVMVNFEKADEESQRRICDFLNGVSYALDCEARRISELMLLYVPNGVSVSTLKPRPTKKS